MKKLLPFFLLFALLGGCAHIPFHREVEKPVQKKKADYNAYALSSFIDGVYSDLSQDYQGAALNYSEALTWDSTSATIYAALGQDYLRIGRVRTGLKLVNKAVLLEPDNPRYREILVSTYEQLGNFKAAIYHEQILLKLHPNDLSEHYHLASLYLVTKQNEKADAEFNKIYELSGKDPKTLQRIADFYLQAKNYKKVIQIYRELIQNQPDKEENYINLGEIYEMNQDTTRASLFLEKTLSEYPSFSKVRRMLSDIYMNQNAWDKALALWKTERDKDPTKIRPYLHIAELYLAEGDTARSILYYGKIQKKFPNDWRPYYNLGRVCLEKKNFKDAIFNLKKAVKINEHIPESWLLLGMVYLQKQDYPSAGKTFSEALKIFPNDPRLNFYYGAVLNQNKKYKEAIAPLQKLLQRNPDYVDGLRELAFAYSNIKEYDKAEKTCLKALKVNPNNLSVILILASVYDEENKYDKVDKLYEKALQIDPNNPVVLNNYAYSLATRGKDISRAMKMAEKALAKEPNNGAYLDTMGWLYYKMGDYKQALKFVRASTEKRKPSAEVLEHLGDIYEKLGNRGKAKYYWKKALEKDKNNERLLQKVARGQS